MSETGTAAPQSFPQALPALTALRLPLAAGVVAFHYHLMWPLNDLAYTGLIERGRLGVDVFFILSGFILAHVYQAGFDAGRFRYGKFLVARVARIFPLHLAILAGMVVVALGARVMGQGFAEESYTWGGLVQTALLVQAWTWRLAPIEWNGPSWSLSAEWFAYLAFPIFAWASLVLRSRPLVLILGAAAAFTALDLLYEAAFGQILTHAEMTLGVLRIAPEFLYGVGLYRLGQRLQPGRAAAITAAAGATTLYLALMHFQVDERLLVAAAGPLVLSLGLLSKAAADQAFAPAWVQIAGEASFALYLVHMPMLVVWKGLVGAATGRASDYLFGWPELAALAAATVLVALAAHLLIERPARNWVRALGARLDSGPAKGRVA